MQPDELDRILGAQNAITPSPEFASAVMKKVLATPEAHKTIDFPWRSMCYGWMTAIVAAGTACYSGVTAPRPLSPAASALIAGTLDRWAAHTTQLVVSPTAGALALALVVMLVPMAVYEVFQRARD